MIKPQFVSGPHDAGIQPISIRCPRCRQMGTFSPVGGCYRLENALSIGMRMCPDARCRAAVTIIESRSGDVFSVTQVYPPETIDFDAANIPPGVLRSFEEAILCHASACYTASAIMIRKTLEEICHDRGATGSSLHQKILALGNHIIVPRELMDGMMELKFLGNDAAHIEVQIFNQVGKDEVEIGLEVTKEILKASYQLSGLVERLKAMKRASAPVSGTP